MTAAVYFLAWLLGIYSALGIPYNQSKWKWPPQITAQVKCDKGCERKNQKRIP